MQWFQQSKWIISIVLFWGTIAHAQQPEVFVQLEHSSSVEAVAFSPDGKFALSGSRDNTLKLWELSSGREIRTLNGHSSWVSAVAFSPDGKLALSASQDKTLKLWEVLSGREILTLNGHSSWVRAVAFCPDGKLALSASQDKTLKLWEVLSGREILTLNGHSNDVKAVAFSPDGKLALSGSRDNTLKLWELSSGREIRTLNGHSSYVYAVAFSPDGKLALSGSYDDTLKLWDVSNGREVRTLNGHSRSVTAVAFSPDGKFALSGSYDKTLKLWDISSGHEVRTLNGHSRSVTAVAFSPDGKLALSGSDDGSTRLWHIQNGEEIAQMVAFKNGEWATVTAQGYYVASAGGEKYINVNIGTQVSSVEPYRAQFNRPELVKVILQSGEIDTTPPRIVLDNGATDKFVTLRGQAIDNSGVAQVTVNGQSVSLDKQGHFSFEVPLQIGENPIQIGTKDIFNNRTSKNITLIHISPPPKDKIVVENTTTYTQVPEVFVQLGHSSSVEAVAFSPDGKLALLGSDDKTLKLWQISSGGEIRTLNGHSEPVLAVAFSPDGKLALSGSSDDTLKLWDVSSGREIRTLKGHSEPILAVAFSPDGKLALSGSDDDTLKLWQVSSGREIRTLKGHSHWINAVAFSPDGKFALSGSWDKSLKLWDVSSGREIRTLKGHSSSVETVAFSPDGKLALSGSSDDILKLWDVSSGREIRTLKGDCHWVNAVAFSPDGKLALSGSSNDALKLWEVSSGREIRILKGHTLDVNAVAFSPDGKLALSGSRDGSTRLWHIQNGEEIAQMVAFKNGEWASVTPQGYYVASAGGEKYINVRVGNKVSAVDPYRAQFNQPDLVKVVLQSGEIDSIPPRIILDGGVTDKLVINTKAYTLRGQAIDNSEVAQVTVNGQSVSLDKQGHFSFEVPLQIGENSAQIIAKDIFNNHARQSITIINNDTNPPQIILSDDKPHVIENATVYILRGQVIDESEIASVTLNGQSVSLDKQGHFSFEVPVQIGENSVQIIAKDIFNNRARQSITLINNDTKPPQILLSEQPANLRGQVIDKSEVASVTVNGQSVSLDKQGYFSFEVPFEPVQIIAKDIFNNRASKNISLISPPQIVVENTIRYTPEVFVQLGHSDNITAVAFSPDGKLALSGSWDNTLKLWDVSNGREIRTFKGHAWTVNAVAFSPDGKLALSGSEDKTLKLWQVSTGREIRTFKGHSLSVIAVAFSPDGKLALSGSEGNTFKLWDVSNGREIRTFKEHGCIVNAVAFSPDGKLALSGFDKTLKLWKIGDSRDDKSSFLHKLGLFCSRLFGQQTFDGHSSWVKAVAFSSDGKFALSGSDDGALKLWEVSSGREIWTLNGHASSVEAVAFSPDGKLALSGSYDKTLKLWDVSSGREIRTLKGHSHIVTAIAFSPDGKFALSGSYDQTIKLWNVSSGREIRTLKGYFSWVEAVAFSPDGKLALSGSYDKTLKLWNVSSGRKIRILKGHSNDVKAVAFSSDGKLALSGSRDKTLKLWDVSSGREIRTFKGHSSSVESVAFSSDGKFALSGSYDQTLKLWDVSNGREIRTFKGHSNDVKAVAFSSDGKLVLSGSDDSTLKLWDVSSGREIRTFYGHSSIVRAVAFTSNGKLALSGSDDGTLKLWDISSGREIRTFYGHSSIVRTVAFSPDDKFALSGSKDKTLKLWDVSSGREIRTFKGHSNDVKAVAFSPDGKLALSGSQDGSTRLWHIQNGEEIAQMVGNSEWVTIIPQNYYMASAGGERYINVRVGNKVSGVEAYRAQFNQPELVKVVLQSDEIDTTSPRIVLDGGDKFVIKTTAYRLRGQAIDNSGVAQVTVNGQAASLDKQGHFSFDVALQIGENAVQITATDIFNNRASKNINLIHITQQPHIIGIKDKIVVENTTTYTLHGQVIDDTGVASLTVNGQAVSLEQEGHFSYQVWLPIGQKKSIRLIATDIDDNSAIQNITLVHRCTVDGEATQGLSRQEIETMHRYKVKVTFKGEHQGRIVPRDINPSCLQQAEFLDLSHLEMVYLPDWLAKLTQLRKLDISHNQLSPEELSLGSLSVLEILDVSHNPLFKESCNLKVWCSIKSSMPAIWQHLSDLRVLNLSHTGGDAENYGDLSHLKRLSKLDLSHNRLSDIASLNLPEIKGLRHLSLSHNKLENMDFVQLSPGLETLDLSHNLLGHLRFAPLERLSKLDLRGNREVSFDIEFGDPFMLQALGKIELDDAVNMPEGLRKKLESWKP
jgi:WD40 repeat protein